MIRPRRSPVATLFASLGCCAIAGFLLLGGCADKPAPVVVTPKYQSVAAKKVQPFLKETIFEKVDVGNLESFQVSGFGLVVNLDNSGDTTAPQAVKEYIVKQMYVHGYGSKLLPGWENQSPERVLNDKRVAIVQVIGMLPPGIRKGQSFDVIVQALPNNSTSSLAGGELYLTDLKINGADARDPFAKVNDYAQSKGPIFVNPAYALNREVQASSAVRRSLRNGVIMDGGVAKYDRPLFLRLRQPESRISRFIEQRIIARFQDATVAKAQDEGVVEIYVPMSYRGDYDHFSHLVTHLYMDGSSEVASHKAKMLVEVAQKPDAPLEDISYCWEGIGPAALPFLAPLLADRRPDIAYAAARAAAYIGDPTGAANVALLDMARNPDHPFQLNAIETLGGLTPSAAVNSMLHELLDSDKPLVRIAAYQVLARNRDVAISSEVVMKDPSNQKFVLDLVPSHASSPIVYATRTGMPRIAIIGTMPQIVTPVVFSAMNGRLTISSREVGDPVDIFYRPPAAADAQGRIHDQTLAEPIHMSSSPEIGEIIERLGGNFAGGEHTFNFNYSEIVAILEMLQQQKKLIAAGNGQYVAASFILQDPPSLQKMIYSAPGVDTGRPQGDESPKISQGYDPAAEAALVGRK